MSSGPSGSDKKHPNVLALLALKGSDFVDSYKAALEKFPIVRRPDNQRYPVAPSSLSEGYYTPKDLITPLSQSSKSKTSSKKSKNDTPESLIDKRLGALLRNLNLDELELLAKEELCQS
eukprot:g3457.t1